MSQQTQHSKMITGTGRATWRSLDEYAGTPEFDALIAGEFPSGAKDLLGSSRRDFLKVMGAGLALAGAATVPGCRRPERKILAYSKHVPEEIIPGKPLYYASSMPLPGGGAEGVLVETHTGRPTHIEGNPLHPINRGKKSIWGTAAILDLYDPDRLKSPVYKGKDATWDDFKAWQGGHFAEYDKRKGKGLAFVVDKKTSPTRDAMRGAIKKRWPAAAWIAWNASESRGAIEGTQVAFGAPKAVHYRLDRAQCVLSLDSDFTAEGADALVNARGFASTRVVHEGGEPMSRLYVAESRPTATGSMGDHRFRMAPSAITALAKAVAAALGVDGVAGDGHGFEHAHAIAEDLKHHGKGSVVIAGDSQPASVHALAAAINAKLGSAGHVVSYAKMNAEQASDGAAGLSGLVDQMKSGAVSTLVCIESNPVYDAPGGLGFADAMKHVGSTITLSVGSTETAAASDWSLNGAHWLESWGDVSAHDGTVSPIQPMIAPLYEPALSDIELLGLLTGVEGDGYALVTGVWGAKSGDAPDSGAFDKLWRRALHDGVLAGSGMTLENPKIDGVRVARAQATKQHTPEPSSASLEVVFTTGRVGDGRFGNNGWLQELPAVGSTVVWDNPVCVSPATAKELGLLPPGIKDIEGDLSGAYTAEQMPKARLATFTVGGRSMEVAVWVMPGMPDGVAHAVLGYGRAHAGKVGDGVGHNVYSVRTGGAATAHGATLKATGKTQVIASTQTHWSMESRTTIVRAMDKKWWDEYAGHVEDVIDPIYGTTISHLTVGEKLGEMSHTPANVSIYENPNNLSTGDVDTEARVFDKALGREMPADYSRGPQWGMAIDLNACNGCGACTIACQSENNIPIVGKAEVAKGRELAWIRVDRYFTGDDLNSPEEMYMQPVACVHCENAPCEVVCPFNATVHGPEGINGMTYNRCVGTRYCANNCPYKVRRYNFFEWSQSKYNGGLDAAYVPDSVRTKFDEGLGKDANFNQNFIPPRLRAKLDEISKMKHNPDVTIRSRGVMEKCSYCIQRVNAARHEVKIGDIWTDADQVGPIPDGFFQAACQQSCPSDAIAFGDILDPASKVSKIRKSHRNYLLLGYLNTRPRTTYLMKVRNPNEEILHAELASRGYSPEEIEKRMGDPLHHAGGEHGAPSHDGGGHGEHGAGSESRPTHGFVDTVKRYTDDGYAMSLRVLGGSIA